MKSFNWLRDFPSVPAHHRGGNVKSIFYQRIAPVKIELTPHLTI